MIRARGHRNRYGKLSFSVYGYLSPFHKKTMTLTTCRVAVR